MIEFFNADIDWVRGLDFDNNLLNERTDETRCGIVELEELDWTVFHFLAPRNAGLWWLRTYAVFEHTLQIFYRALQEQYVKNILPEEHLTKLPLLGFFKKHGIKAKSSCAYNSFGLYPKLWGNTFMPKGGHNGLIVRRYESVAVPRSMATATRQYFSIQAEAFGDNCVSHAGEDNFLWNSGQPVSKDFLLFCGGPEQATKDELSKWLARLERLNTHKDERENFAAVIDTQVKFSGQAAVGCGNRYLWEKRTKEYPIYIEILKARIALVCTLGWPLFLDSAKNTLMQEEWLGNPVGFLLPSIELELKKFPITQVNPLAGHLIIDGGGV